MDRWADYIYRTLTIIVLIFSGSVAVSAKSTDDEFKIEAFRALETDLDARLYAKTDENGRKAALIKVVTNEKGFSFDVGVMGIVDCQQEIGEIWLYVPEGIRRITIKHPSFGIIRDYEFNVPIRSACVYEIILNTPEREVSPSIRFIEKLVARQDSSLINLDSATLARIRTESLASIRKRVRKHVCENHIMLVAGLLPDISEGLMFGQTFRRKGASMGAGWFLKLRSDFGFNTGYDYKCSSDGAAGDGQFWAKENGKAWHSRQCFTIGGMWRCNKWLDVYSGTGLGVKTLVWEDVDSRRALVTDYSYRGLEMDLGALFSFGKFSFGAGVSTTRFKYVDFEASIGIRF